MIARACPSAAYDDRTEAAEIKRRIQRTYHLSIAVRQCEDCDKYHLRADVARLRLPKGCMTIIRYLALGYTIPEASRITGIKKRTAQWYIDEMKFAFSALSIPHLIAILISLGQLDPRDYVPELTERCSINARPRNHKRGPVQRSSEARLLPSA